MKTFLKTLCIALLFLVFQTFQPDQPAVQADDCCKIYLPSIDLETVPQRLGPYVSSVYGLAISPQNPAIVYAGTWGGGMYKSIDSGKTWQPVSVGLDNLFIQAVAVDATNPDVVYAGTYYDPAVYSGVYKSVDGGIHWSPTGAMVNTYHGQPISKPIVYALIVDPTDGNTAYAGTRMADLVPGQPVYGGGGVFRTTDGGATWTPVNTGLPPEDLYIYDLAINPQSTRTIYTAMHQSGVYRSDNQGDTWYSLNATIPADPQGIVSSGRAIVVDPLNPLRLFYGTWHTQGIFRSDDGGLHWYYRGLSGKKILYMSIDPANPEMVYATTYPGVYDTANGGQSWLPIDTGAYYSRTAVDPLNDQVVYIGLPGQGILKSSDRGIHFNYSHTGLSGYPMVGTAVLTGNPPIFYAGLTGRGVMKSLDGGANWFNVNNGLPDDPEILSLAMDAKNQKVLYATTRDQGVYVTRNAGGSWNAISIGYPISLLPALPEFRPIPQPEVEEGINEWKPELATSIPATGVAVSPFDSKVVVVGTAGKGILRFNGTDKWLVTSQASGVVHSFLFDAFTPGMIYAGVDAPSGGLLYTLTNGVDWAVLGSGLAGRTVYSISQGHVDTVAFAVGTDAGVFISSDGGQNWQPAGLAAERIEAVLVHPAREGVLLAGSAQHLYLSYDSGASWHEIYPNLYGYHIQAIYPDPADPNAFFLATKFGGLVRIIIG